MSNITSLGSAIDNEEVLRRSCLTHSEVLREMRSERKRPKRLKEEEELRQEKIRYPWRYKTEKPMTEPPDINYRRNLYEDQTMIDILFRRNIHFTHRCLEYQRHDGEVEWREAVIRVSYIDF